MTPVFPNEVQSMLRQASDAPKGPRFSCRVFSPEWNQFVELWAPRIYSFVHAALGEWGTEPKTTILEVSDGFHAAGANASFNIVSGQIRLAKTLEGKPGVLLEKLTHEMIHGSLSRFPEGDPYYEEGYVDYSVYVAAHAPTWEPYREAMIEAATENIRIRRERALKTGTDYDRKRWSGCFYASTAFGPHIITSLRTKKEENNFTW